MRVAYQGEAGAYSESAIHDVFPIAESLPCNTLRLVFSRVTSGEADFGVVPLENSQAGSVNETYELLADSSLVRIRGESIVRVDHALLALPGARLEAVERAYSHWQALAQSEDFLAVHHINAVPVHDTAGAARMVAEAGDVNSAAVASVEAAEKFGLIVLAERIQTHRDNFTKFAVIGTRDAGLGPAAKTSFLMVVADRPGSLLASLQPFAERSINLVKLESRPRRGAPFEYVFYVDVERAEEDAQLQDAFTEVRSHTSMFKVLGSYPSAHSMYQVE